jgi:hypothetical protein
VRQRPYSMVACSRADEDLVLRFARRWRAAVSKDDRNCDYLLMGVYKPRGRHCPWPERVPSFAFPRLRS